MKKSTGDWGCTKSSCTFRNFSRRTICARCGAPRPPVTATPSTPSMNSITSTPSISLSGSSILSSSSTETSLFPTVSNTGYTTFSQSEYAELQAQLFKLESTNSELQTQNALLQTEVTDLKRKFSSVNIPSASTELPTELSSFKTLFSEYNSCCATCSVEKPFQPLSTLLQNHFNLITPCFGETSLQDQDNYFGIKHHHTDPEREQALQNVVSQLPLGSQLSLLCLPAQRYFFSQIQKMTTLMKPDRDILLAHYLQDIASSSAKKKFVNVSIHVSTGSSTSSDSLSRNPLPDLLHDNVEITISRTFRDTTLGYQLKDALLQDVLFDAILQVDNEANRSRLKQLLHNSVVVPQLTRIPLAHQATSLSQIGTSLFTLHWDECAYISSLNPISSSSSSPSSSSNNPQAQIDSLFNTMNSVILDEEQDTWSTFITSAVSIDTSRLFIPYYKLKQLAAETHYLQSTIPNSQALLGDAKNTDAKIHQSKIHNAQGIPMQIRAKTLMGKTITLDVCSLDTVLQLKEQILNKAGILPSKQRLIFAGTQLQDDRTLADHNIKNDSFLLLVMGVW